MPYFHIEWVKREQWSVEAPNEDAARKAAEEMFNDVDLDFDDRDVYIRELSKKPVHLAAVLVNDSFIAPSDAEDERYRCAAREIVQEMASVSCPACDEEVAPEYAVEYDSKGRVMQMKCPKCGVVWEMEDLACFTNLEHREADMLARQGELPEVE
jgi:endogenous inhibitor of DNA gyrase (YacG/DUF329 family)